MKKVMFVLMIVFVVALSIGNSDCYAQYNQMSKVRSNFHTGNSDIVPESMNTEVALGSSDDLTLLNHKPTHTKKPLLALKTNLLFDVATALNVELEVPIGKRWSIAGEYVFPWWIWEKKQTSLEVINGNLEGRYWLGNRENYEVMTGWFAGIYGGGGYYDLEWKKKGYQGEFYSIGLTGGFTHKIGKNLRMEYSLGLGYLGTKYRKYKACDSAEDGDWHLIRVKSGHEDWIGPTRVKISLVWMLNKKYIVR